MQMEGDNSADLNIELVWCLKSLNVHVPIFRSWHEFQIFGCHWKSEPEFGCFKGVNLVNRQGPFKNWIHQASIFWINPYFRGLHCIPRVKLSISCVIGRFEQCTYCFVCTNSWVYGCLTTEDAVQALAAICFYAKVSFSLLVNKYLPRQRLSSRDPDSRKFACYELSRKNEQYKLK